MGTGTGLFLGLVFCGSVFLYSQTKDRWNWSKLKKIGKWLAITLVIAIVITIVYLNIKEIKEEQNIWDTPKVTNELMGIKLNDSFKDVEFKFGHFIPAGWDDKIGYSDLKRLSTPDLELISEGKYDQLSDGGIKLLSETSPHLKESIEGGHFKSSSKTYPQDKLRLIIKDKRVEAIQFDCGDFSDLDVVVNTISCNTSGEDLQKKFGKDIRVLCSKNNTNLERVYDVVRYGVRYHLSQNKVSAFLIAEPKVLETHFLGKNWDKCE